MRKKIILPSILALSVLLVGILASNAKALETSNYPPIVQRIADRFSLNVSEVEKVFDEERDERRAEKFARFADRLDDLVSEGKISKAQKEAILDWHEKINDEMEKARNLSFEERREKMQSIQEEFRNWLKSEGINETNLGCLGMGFGKGFGMNGLVKPGGRFMMGGGQ